MSSFDSESYRSIFLEEVEEQLLVMEEEILKLEHDGESAKAISTLFRAAHTIKGSSAAMGFEEMKQLTHEMEHILDLVRNKLLSVTRPLIDLLFVCIDHLQTLKEEYVLETALYTDIAPLVSKLKQFTKSPVLSAVTAQAQEEADATPSFSLSLDAEYKVKEAIDAGYYPYVIRVKMEETCVMKAARAFLILNVLSPLGEVIQTVPAMEGLKEETDLLFFEVLFVSTMEAEQLQKPIASMIDISHVDVTPFSFVDSINTTEKGVHLTAGSPSSTKVAVPDDKKRKSQTIRVDVERLEQLMNLVGELVIDQTRIHQVGNLLNQRYAADDTVGELEQISDHVSRVVGELQEHVMKVRMLPVEQLFNRFPRMVRDLSQSLDKEIELLIQGQETEMDRTVIEEIGDPLIHLIRNAVDHGIESKAERRQNGKPEKGLVTISAAYEENQVIIIVSDDGAGIDSSKIKASALRKDIITMEESDSLTDKEALQLIFKAGFSTVDMVTDVSGRGVGMDIVRSHIEKLNGIVEIETDLGKGTQFKIKLPLTLAIISGLLVELGTSTYILPMSNVVEIVRIPEKQVQSIRGEPFVIIRGQVLPLIQLHEHLQVTPKSGKSKHISMVIVGNAEKRIALVVDKLKGNQDIVVKMLGAYIGKVPCISGATILGNGRVALIVEVPGIFNRIGRVLTNIL